MRGAGGVNLSLPDASGFPHAEQLLRVWTVKRATRVVGKKRSGLRCEHDTVDSKCFWRIIVGNKMHGRNLTFLYTSFMLSSCFKFNSTLLTASLLRRAPLAGIQLLRASLDRPMLKRNWRLDLWQTGLLAKVKVADIEVSRERNSACQDPAGPATLCSQKLFFFPRRLQFWTSKIQPGQESLPNRVRAKTRQMQPDSRILGHIRRLDRMFALFCTISALHLSFGRKRWRSQTSCKCWAEWR